MQCFYFLVYKSLLCLKERLHIMNKWYKIFILFVKIHQSVCKLHVVFLIFKNLIEMLNKSTHQCTQHIYHDMIYNLSILLTKAQKLYTWGFKNIFYIDNKHLYIFITSIRLMIGLSITSNYMACFCEP